MSSPVVSFPVHVEEVVIVLPLDTHYVTQLGGPVPYWSPSTALAYCEWIMLGRSLLQRVFFL